MLVVFLVLSSGRFGCSYWMISIGSLVAILGYISQNWVPVPVWLTIPPHRPLFSHYSTHYVFFGLLASVHTLIPLTTPYCSMQNGIIFFTSILDTSDHCQFMLPTFGMKPLVLLKMDLFWFSPTQLYVIIYINIYIIILLYICIIILLYICNNNIYMCNNQYWEIRIFLYFLLKSFSTSKKEIKVNNKRH